MRNYKTAYSIITGLEVKAWECQVEKGTYQLPADSTFKKPLVAKDGYNIIYKDSKWNYKKIPEPPKPKAPTLAEIKETKILEAKAKRDKDLSEDVEVKQGTFQHSATSDINLIGYKECLEIGCKSMISWKLKNNIKVKLTTEIINDWLKTIAKQRNQVYQDYFDLKEKIDNAKTISTLNKIEIK